mmetsp:Transcript_25593/g.61545  ORF Transcript_25593/g.61545 Transcript_25593/m.61545 type:complete len:364 (+) Transcript_25593:125-1216(+)
MADQKNKTKEYWNTFYLELPSTNNANRFATGGNPSSSANDDDTNINRSSDLEWIVPNSLKLLNTVLSLFPPSDKSAGEIFDRTPQNASKVKGIHDSTDVNVLEIGCGVSQLSLCLLRRLLLTRQETAPRPVHKRKKYNFVSTDVSLVCVEHNRTRDDAFISSVKSAGDNLSYEVLDVVKVGSSPPHTQQYDVILDKGTLDTFLFRSKRTKKGSSSHPPLLTPLLNNLHRWLRSGCEAKYIIISPRSKIKSVRDFRGFDSVRRIRVDTAKLDGDLVLVKGNSKNASLSRSEVYLYECIKNDCYNPEKDVPYHSSGYDAKDESTCTKCGMSFKEFRGNVDVRDQGEIAWARRWKNHSVHCSGITK